MPKLTKQNVQVIKRVLDTYATHAKLNQTWEYMHREYRVGRRDRNNLFFTPQDRAILQQIVLNDTGLDLHEAIPTGTRTAVAALAIDEKWADESIQQHRIYVSSKKPIQLTDGVVHLGGDSVAWIDWRKLDIARIDTLVIVENIEAITHWPAFVLPDALESALAIYRGHDISATAVVTLLAALPSTTRVIWFIDFDPAGLVIANSAVRCDGLVIPANPLSLEKHSHVERFNTQWSRYHSADAKLPANWISLWNLMTTHKLAISQEALCATQTPLNLLIEKTFNELS